MYIVVEVESHAVGEVEASKARMVLFPLYIHKDCGKLQ